MLAGDIVFVKGHSIIDCLIRLFDPGPFTHVALAVSSTQVIEADLFTNVRIVPFHYEDYEVVSIGLDPVQRVGLQQAANEYVGRQYDYLQLFWYVIDDIFHLDGRNLLNSANDVICSEVISDIFIRLEIFEKDELLRDMTPNELYQYVIRRFRIRSI